MSTEWNAASYHQINSLQQWLGEESLSRLELGPAEHVLDVGCGDGRLTAELAARVPRGAVLGVDPSHKMVDYATETYSAANLSFRLGDARDLGLEGGFDRLVSFNALHWVPRGDFPRALDSLRKALKPGGRAHLRLVGKGPRTALEVVAQEAAPNQPAPFTHFTLDEFYPLVGQHGFAIESMELLDRHWDFPEGGFAAWAETTFVPWTGGMSESQAQAFIQQVLERYGAVVGRPERFCFYQMVSELI